MTQLESLKSSNGSKDRVNRESQHKRQSLPLISERIGLDTDIMAQDKLHNSALSPDEEIFIPIDLKPKWATAWKKSGTEDFFNGVKPGESHAGPSSFYLSRRRASLPPNVDMSRFANRRDKAGDDTTSSERLQCRHGSIPNSEDKLPQLHSSARRASLPPNSKLLPGQSKLLDRRGSLPENTIEAPPNTPINASRLRNRRASLPNSASLEAYAKFRNFNRDKLKEDEDVLSPRIFNDNRGITDDLSLSPYARRRGLVSTRAFAHSDDKSENEQTNTFPNISRGQISPRRLRPVTPVPSICAAGIEQLYPEVYLTPKPPKEPPTHKEQNDANSVNVSSNTIAENKQETEASKPVSIAENNREAKVSKPVEKDQNDNDNDNMCSSNSDSSSFVDSADDEHFPTHDGEGWVKTFEMMTLNSSSVDTAFADVFSTYMSKMQFNRILNWLDGVEDQKTKVVRTGTNDFAMIHD